MKRCVRFPPRDKRCESTTVVVRHAPDRLHARAEDLAADYRARGYDRQSAYGQFVRDRILRPEMDARSFAAIFDAAVPQLLADDGAEVQFRPTHRDTFLDTHVQVTPTSFGHALVWSFGMSGTEPGPLPNRYQPEREEITP